jgi:CDP-glucose 4,6-dehydratase
MFFNDAYAGRKVLITGHTGFKGSWLSAWLDALGAEVCGYSDAIPTSPSLFEKAGLAARIDHQLGDVRDLARFSHVLNAFQPDYVFHLAAQAIVSTSYSRPLETIDVNVMGTATVLEALRGAEWPCTAVIITSDKVYDNVEWPWGYRETDALGGKDVYSGSKGGAELAFKSYFHSFFAQPGVSVRLATARAGNVIGGGDWAADRIIADCVRAWCDDRTVEIRSPQSTRPWQHVLEPLSGYLWLGARLAEDMQFNGEAYNFGPRAEQNATVLELLAALADVWGHENPTQAYNITGNIPFHEASLLKLNVDKALLTMKWEPNLSYAECMTMTGEWYREVLKAGQDALIMTRGHITAYQDRAAERGRVWARP